MHISKMTTKMMIGLLGREAVMPKIYLKKYKPSRLSPLHISENLIVSFSVN